MQSQPYFDTLCSSKCRVEPYSAANAATCKRRMSDGFANQIVRMPSRPEPSGRASLFVSASGEIPLLLVVHRGVFELFALRIGSARRDRAGFAIGRHDNSAGDSNLSAFLDG